MAKFVIEPHFRLQEWVAEEKGYFADEGLDYVFQEKIRSTDGKQHDQQGQKAGAYQSFEAGRTADVSCACHWTVNVAASNGHGKLWGDIYSVAPAGVFVPEGSPIRKPEDLAGVPISVGFQSGSHYSTIQALEQYMPADRIKLTFEDGISAPGKYVEMRAEMDVTVLISNCPQLNNPCNGYNPTPVRLTIWEGE